jgi:hypothetical protein
MYAACVTAGELWPRRANNTGAMYSAGTGSAAVVARELELNLSKKEQTSNGRVVR